MGASVSSNGFFLCRLLSTCKCSDGFPCQHPRTTRIYLEQEHSLQWTIFFPLSCASWILWDKLFSAPAKKPGWGWRSVCNKKVKCCELWLQPSLSSDVQAERLPRDVPPPDLFQQPPFCAVTVPPWRSIEFLGGVQPIYLLGALWGAALPMSPGAGQGCAEELSLLWRAPVVLSDIRI